ncbi:MAG: hypothetical protein H0T53_05890 [Herpetosiphonaceae bacterium]|nr:hypothetical protein [Herpetosiphonaceae bacterium]
MSDSYAYLEISALQELRAIQRRNLAFLASQADKFGDLYVPLHIQNQLEEAKAKIDGINAELARRGVASSDPPPNTSLPEVVRYYVDARTINTGGDYAEGSIDKQGQVNISGGTVYGAVTGTNEGTINVNQNTGDQQQPAAPLRQAHAEAQQQAAAARQSGSPTARALMNAEFSLESALRAEASSNASERAAAISQARQDVQAIREQAAVQALVRLLDQL